MVLLSVVAWTVVLSVLVMTDNTLWAVLLLLAISARLAVVLARRHLALMTVVVLGLFAYSFCVAAVTTIATGHEEEPFGPYCEGDDLPELILGRHCD